MKNVESVCKVCLHKKIAANLQEPELQTCCQRAPDGESRNSAARFHSSETTKQPSASVATQLLHPLSDRSPFLFPPTGVLGNVREGVLCPSPRLILSSPTSISKKIPKRAHLIHRQRTRIQLRVAAESSLTETISNFFKGRDNVTLRAARLSSGLF